jgi:hypothetical protein
MRAADQADQEERIRQLREQMSVAAGAAIQARQELIKAR